MAIEKRAGEQVRAAREEAARQAQEATRLEMDLEKQVGGEGPLHMKCIETNQSYTHRTDHLQGGAGGLAAGLG